MEARHGVFAGLRKEGVPICRNAKIFLDALTPLQKRLDIRIK
jgi:hypothetical protein